MRTMLATTALLVVMLLASPVWPQAGAKPVEDVKILAGHWRGYPFTRTGQRLSNQFDLYVKDDGTYEAHGSGVGRTDGSLHVSAGKVTFQSTRTSGTVTLHEEKGQQTLKFWFDNGSPAGEYDRVK